MAWWEALIAIYFVTHFLGIPVIGWVQEEFGVSFLSPRTLYKYCKVNLFGAGFLWLLHLIFTPIYALIGLFIWLCTAGRKD